MCRISFVTHSTCELMGRFIKNAITLNAKITDKNNFISLDVYSTVLIPKEIDNLFSSYKTLRYWPLLLLTEIEL